MWLSKGLKDPLQIKIKACLVTSKEVIKAYFKSNPVAEKFYNILLAFLNLIQELFNKVLVIGSYIKLINKVIKSFIDSKLLLKAALQALNLANKEDKKEIKEVKEAEKTKEEVDKTFKLKLA